MNRYIEVFTKAGVDDEHWMKVRDRLTKEVFLVGLCARETQLRVLKALNYYVENHYIPNEPAPE